MDEHVRASKFLAYVLRHHPEDLGLELDPDGGWVSVQRLLDEVNAARRFARPWTNESLKKLVARENNRFRMDADRICAVSGHSVPGVKSAPRLAPEPKSRTPKERPELQRERRRRPPQKPVEPPTLAYFLTTAEHRRTAERRGLRSRPGHWLRLESDWSKALEKRERSAKSVVLIIDARRAHESGVKFFSNANGDLRVHAIPRRFIWRHDDGLAQQRSAGCVVVAEGTEGPKFILIRTRPREDVARERVESPREAPPIALDVSPPPSREPRQDWRRLGRLELPKGKIELGESAGMAALRELREETGISVDLEILCPLPSIHYVYRLRGGRAISKSVAFFLVRSSHSAPEFRPRRQEGIVGVEWHRPDKAVDVVAFDNLRPILEVARDLVSQGLSKFKTTDDRP